MPLIIATTGNTKTILKYPGRNLTKDVYSKLQNVSREIKIDQKRGKLHVHVWEDLIL